MKPSTDRSAPSADKILEFQLEHLEVPAGIQRDAVVGEHQLAPLHLGEPAQRDDRHLRQAEQARRGQAAVTGDDVAVLADQDRIGESERADAAGDLGDLRVAVGARVARRRNQPIERPELKPRPAGGRGGVRLRVRCLAHLTIVLRLPPPP